ncbi:hypothetical protein A3H80_05040 [Candidatus Roizmanbacteria bacterium RIFCSPLOWO2_02_FULL_37_19]|nr:MAG: hypothetical protein A3H80_05040 [Candidatus Roizmanbacteria bacterium RIFCSPLOWO2_02_FULL_37_19]OGK61383.1 MAG: hypothetical protein A3G65_01555 [Candidatus Roizmanbacteria bacterium RIFCSPLOWO2_12_FULL_37_7b]
MVYLYLGEHTIKLLSLTKTLLGQYNLTSFSKTHSSPLFEDGQIKNIDLVASAIKEALTSAKPTQVSDREIVLILPQKSFTFGRYDVPKDMSDTAVLPFIKDKVRSDLNIDIENEYYDYVFRQHNNDSALIFYSQTQKNRENIDEVLKLLQLKVVKIIPESLAFYTLFEKTLRKEKKEKILFISFEKQGSFGYLYDSQGLFEKEKIELGDDIKSSLKKKVAEYEDKNIKINRVILSGSQSSAVRQDLFTKDVGVWTNPLEKIIDNFYQDYLKLVAPNMDESFSILQFDVCFGSFIFVQENKDFSLLKQEKASSGFSLNLPSLHLGFLSGIFSLKTLGIFMVSFVISFGIIYGLSNMGNLPFAIKLPTQKQEVTDKPIIKPTKTPTPTPSIAREEVKIKVLNGSGTKGKAATVKEILLEAGYSDILTDNADSFDFETTEVQIKKDKDVVFDFLKTDLQDYVSLKEFSTLSDEENADVIITIGADFE